MHKDVTELSDDKNPGAFNVFAHCGKLMGVVCLTLDILKGFIPVLLASLFMNSRSVFFAFVIAAPVLGHAIGMFNGFRGGKCISTSFGVMAGIIPVTSLGLIMLAALYIFFSGIVRVKPNRKCSVIVYGCFLIAAVVLNALGYYSVAFGCGIVSATALYRHLNVKTESERTSENAVD